VHINLHKKILDYKDPTKDRKDIFSIYISVVVFDQISFIVLFYCRN